ncbi:MAG: 30S ribosome-binding factor RbfA [Clostridia bacterium]|nr:30S ribosome-binding factor RbfA [Clostridia bacterium]MBR2943820.1 30S ribosome-binding factor RbfA [Clostridia bacterium]
MAKYRRNRINDAVKEEMAQILRDVKDPRIAGALVSITGANVSGDLKFAKIYYSVLGGDKTELARALKSASGFFRSELARRINLRITPELSFEYDSSAEYGANISSILKTLDIKDEEDENE